MNHVLDMSSSYFLVFFVQTTISNLPPLSSMIQKDGMKVTILPNTLSIVSIINYFPILYDITPHYLQKQKISETDAGVV